MNFTEAIDEVVRITSRPDKRNEAAAQLNRALSYFTLKGDFARDLTETNLAIDATLYGQSVSIAALTRFRKFKYIRPTGQRFYLEEADPTHVFTPGGNIQPNRYFIGGTSLTLTLSVLDSSLQIGYFSYAPTLTEIDGSNTHWLLDMVPYCVIEKAAAKIFQLVGDDTSLRFYEASATELFLAARRDFGTSL